MIEKKGVDNREFSAQFQHTENFQQVVVSQIG
ncbi:uncharacterized protein METZ01_LOCUS174134, partial [marine metagenome]